MMSDRVGDARPLSRRDESSTAARRASRPLRDQLAAARRTDREAAAGAGAQPSGHPPPGDDGDDRRPDRAGQSPPIRIRARRVLRPPTRQGSPLSVVMVDVDGFKSYNDAFGHSAGDEVLCIIARQLLTSTRPATWSTRYGGEEFAIVLPDADATAARRDVPRRQRVAIESFGWPLRPVTASFGVATRTASIGDLATLVEEADRALYASKRSGRNRVTHLGLIDDGGRPPSAMARRPSAAGTPSRTVPGHRSTAPGSLAPAIAGSRSETRRSESSSPEGDRHADAGPGRAAGCPAGRR